MRVDAATPEDIAEVANAIRDGDVTEFLAVSRAVTRADLVADLCQRLRHRTDLICAHGDKPIAIGGLIEHRPNVATLLFFATPEFPTIALPLTRFIRQRLFKHARAAGVHRIECVSIGSYEKAHRWIRVLGLTQEAVLPGYGKGGEAFLQFAWVKQ